MGDYYTIYMYLNNELVLETNTDEQGGLFKLGEVIDLIGIKVKVIEQNRSITNKTIRYDLKKV